MRFWFLLLIADYAHAKTVKKSCEKNFDLVENEETNVNIHLKEKRFLDFLHQTRRPGPGSTSWSSVV